jgi:soluble lytic murein transglycosylase-like protein
MEARGGRTPGDVTLPRTAAAAVTAALLALAAPAAADVPHTVGPGETLWSIAAANGFTTRALAAANGLPEDAGVVLGSTIQIPSVTEAAAALNGATAELSSVPPSTGAATPAAQAPPPAGSYVVRPGDSLSAIAARAGIEMSRLAWMNGVDPARPLLVGTVLKLPSGSAPAPSVPAPAARVVPAAAPRPTSSRLSAAQVGQAAAEEGVPPSLATAIAWQESGFNNGMVSSANARGVMQVMPGTWDWINNSLASRTLDPNSAIDNVHAGSLYLGQLLRDTGGDPAMAAAAYYQGLASVRQNGMLPETRRYVDNVMALRSRFGD